LETDMSHAVDGLLDDLRGRLYALDRDDREAFVLLARLVEDDATRVSSRATWRLLECLAALVAAVDREQRATIRAMEADLRDPLEGWQGPTSLPDEPDDDPPGDC
jgi:hypothetical protein